MVLFKFKPLAQLAHLLDIIVNERLYCHHYEELNDPFEGQFERMVGRGAVRRDFGTAGELDREVPTRICSLSRCCDDVRMWSLYAGSFAGVAVQLELDPAHLPLYPVRLSAWPSSTRRVRALSWAAAQPVHSRRCRRHEARQQRHGSALQQARQ